jgi:hypothetical protein
MSMSFNICFLPQKRDIMSHVAKSLLVALLVFTSASLTSRAQGVYGTVQGTVTDSSGASIPNTEVTSRELSTGITQKVATNQNGIYVLSSMRPGTYEISAHKAGFSDSTRTGVVVSVGDQISLNMIMMVGGVTSTVQVSGEAPLVRSDDTIVGSVIDERTIKEL